jgi:aryl-alcohol dehydrogenase-like predicted oxidoreductase
MVRQQVLSDENCAKAERLKRLSETVGLSCAQIAISWVLRKSYVSSVLIGATTIEQLEENIGAASVTYESAVENALEDIFGYCPEEPSTVAM